MLIVNYHIYSFLFIKDNIETSSLIVTSSHKLLQTLDRWRHQHNIKCLHKTIHKNIIYISISPESSSVLFAYSFLLLFGQFENIYKVKQDSLYFFFLEGGFKGIYLRERNFYPFVCGFRDMNF